GILLVVPDIADAFGPAPSVPQPLRYTRQIDPAVAIGAAQFPQAAIRDIRFPLADRIDINFFAPQRNPRAVHIVSVRLSDLQVTKRLPAAENPVLWMKLLSLHTGESFGLIGRLLLLAEAMVLVFLTITGPIMWWRGRGKRK
ncbi:MAG: PepSY-associated TM helix domain-containing protein, partial [Novosphingobium sp.]